jgi:hypothetical protein
VEPAENRKGKNAKIKPATEGYVSIINRTDGMNLVNTSKDVRRATMDPPTCCQGVEPAGGENGEKAKTKPVTIKQVSIVDFNAYN